MKLLGQSAYDIMIQPPALLLADQTLTEALWILDASNMQRLPVCSPEGYLEGFISLNDIAWLFPPTRTALQKIEPKTKYRVDIPKLKVKDLMKTDVITRKQYDTVYEILTTLTTRHLINDNKQHITSIPIVTDDTLVVGIISYVEVLLKIDVGNLIVADLMTKERIPTVYMEDTLDAANLLMKTFGERFILVVDYEQMPVGIISNLEVTRHMQKNHNFSKLPVNLAMTHLPYFAQITPQDSLHKVIHLFTNPSYSFRAVPVVEDGVLCGIISYLNILRSIMELSSIW
ncbi:MAG: hypothetical protein DPW16_14215 [Chloroflexi bacterium]|nr:hypothetical protein [Chloroflexota bacterium]